MPLLELKMPSCTSAVREEPTNARPRLAHQSFSIPIVVPSFLEVYKSYFNFVWSMSRYLGVDRSELDDVVQEIFVGIQARLHTVEHPESLRSWIYSIIRRTVSRYHRIRRARLIETGTENVEPEMLEQEWATPQTMAEQTEQVNLISSLLQKLDAPKREVFILAEIEEMTAPEIAAAIDVPLNTVYSRLRAARQELEQALQRHTARRA